MQNDQLAKQQQTQSNLTSVSQKCASYTSYALGTFIGTITALGYTVVVVPLRLMFGCAFMCCCYSCDPENAKTAATELIFKIPRDISELFNNCLQHFLYEASEPHHALEAQVFDMTNPEVYSNILSLRNEFNAMFLSFSKGRTQTSLRTIKKIGEVKEGNLCFLQKIRVPTITDFEDDKYSITNSNGKKCLDLGKTLSEKHNVIESTNIFENTHSSRVCIMGIISFENEIPKINQWVIVCCPVNGRGRLSNINTVISQYIESIASAEAENDMLKRQNEIKLEVANIQNQEHLAISDRNQHPDSNRIPIPDEDNMIRLPKSLIHHDSLGLRLTQLNGSSNSSTARLNNPMQESFVAESPVRRYQNRQEQFDSNSDVAIPNEHNDISSHSEHQSSQARGSQPAHINIEVQLASNPVHTAPVNSGDQYEMLGNERLHTEW